MPLPKYEQIMLPLLKAVANGQDHRLADLVEQMAEHFGLTAVERSERYPSGRAKFDSGTAWARTDLVQAHVLEATGRGSVRITDRGRELLADRPDRIDRALLSRYPEFRDFLSRSRRQQVVAEGSAMATGLVDNSASRRDIREADEAPEEAIARAVRQINEALADELLAQIKQLPASFFEKLVLDLLVAMGYGGTLEDASTVVGQSGDGGIDGIIKEDKLGLDMIYVQAKRWDNVVGRPIVQGFAGSLQGVRASKGVLLTTARFSADARDYVERIATRIVLIDGPTLARLMIEHNVGVAAASTYQIKRIDSDYFSEA